MRLVRLGLFGLSVLAMGACSDIDTSRELPARGTVGEEVFGIFCDRVAGQALREDLTGASFHGVCHKVNGQFTDTVDEALLPPPTSDAVDQQGNPVPLAKQQADRAYAISRIGALTRRRQDLIAAIDAVVPDVKVAVKDVSNPDATRSCDAPAASGEDSLPHALADMLSRFATLYDDGTLPHSTESLGDLMNSIQASPDAQAAFARIGARLGYRPVATALGAARPAMAYPRLRDLANATLRVISDHSDAYDPGSPPGSANAQFNQALAVLEQELRTAQPSAASTPLGVTPDAVAGRSVLSRPRTTLEALQTVMLDQDPSFGGGASRYIVRRDPRGFAAVPLVGGVVPAPFVDQDADGLPDIDALGRFVSTNGQAPPAPFFAADAPAASAYDTFGRALDANKLLYDYVDTSHTFTASALRNLEPLLDPNAQDNHETLMYVLGGADVILGPRDGAPMTQKVYGDAQSGQVTITYDAFHPEASPLLDLVYAVGQLLGDAPTDAMLEYSSMLMKDHTAELARVVGAGLTFKDVADKHPEAQLPAKSVFWDEILDVLVQIEQEPGLLEDVLRSLGSDQALPLNGIFADYMSYRDHISYDRKNLNGKAYNFDTADNNDMKTPVDRTKADTGWNRSAFLRFLQAIHDTNGVTACNKEGAVLHAKGVPILGSGDICAGSLALCNLLGTRPFHECEVFKIDNLAKFYVDSIVGRATLYLRPSVLRNGILGIGAATVDMMQQSSGITGFWDAGSSHTLRPTPQFLNRQVFFDVANDSPNPGDLNYTTNRFLVGLMGQNSVGTAACPEKVINDPDPGAADASSDGKVHGLRQCAPGDSLEERDPDATFVLENFGSFAAMTPLINAFAIHGREDLFIALMDTIYRHWQDDKGTTSECDKCTKDGANSYEPLLAEALPGDLLPGLAALTKTLSSATIPVCTATDPKSHQCTASKTEDGVAVMADATRGMVDPARAKSAGLTDRNGGVTAPRNDGTTNPQVTPVYLLTGALDGIDAAFAKFPQKSPSDAQRLPNWHLGRSQLVDQFLSVKGSGTSSAFADPSIPTITPTLVDMLRAQMLAHCPDSYGAPYTRCAWARDELTNSLSDRVKGPLFATAMDLVDAIRQDDGARTQLEAMLQYMVDSASDNDALAAMLAASTDALQVLDDDQNLVPIFHALAPALAPTQKDANGNVVKKSLVDAQLALLARIAGKYVDKQSGTEICAREMDPNQILSQILTHLVTPMTDSSGRATQAPLEVIMDVIADVNRKNPAQTDKLAADDYGAIASQVSSFLLDKQRGLEQFYEVVRKGTQE